MRFCAVLSFLLIFVLIGSVSAADADMNASEMISASDNNEILTVEHDLEVLSNNPGKYSDLSTEISAGGDVTLAHDYYAYDSGAPAITISGDNRVINGNGAVIDMDGSNNIRAFSVTGSGVTIKNLTIKNANYNGDGAAIYFDNLGTVENCNFIDNVASSEGGAIYFFYLGSSHEGNCKVKNCNFINNKVTGSGYGGAVYFPDVYGCAVENCNFTNNSAYYGGAIYFLFSSRGTVENCNFIDNFASANGGAVFSDADDLIFEKCNFINNTASGDGDAIYLARGSVSVNDNWWGSNNPDFTKLIKGVTPSSYAVLNVTADSQSIAPGSKATLNYAFYRNGTNDVVSLPLRSISLSTTGGQLDDDSGYLVDGRFSTQFGSSVGGNFEITATVDNQELKTNIVVDDPTPHPVLLPSKVTVPSRTSADYGTDVIIQATDLVNAYGIGAILLDSNGAKIRDLDVSGLNIFVDTDDLNVGTYNVLVYTLVDTTKYYSYSTYSALFINKGTAVVSVDIGDVEYGKPIDVSVDVLGGTGKVNVTVAGITKSSDLVNGSSKFTFDAITNPGKYDVDVVYYGDAKYDDFHTSKSIEVVAPSVIIADNIRRGVNSSYDYCATLLDANAKPIAGREITFTIAGKTLKATTDANGIAKVSAGLVLVDNAETVYDVVVTNPDTLENVTATTTIVPRLLVVSGDLTADYLENPPYVVQAIGDDANPVGEGETVNVVFAGFGYDMLTNATGHVVRTIGLAPGMYAVKACYKGYNTTATVFVVNQILKVTSGALKKTAKSYTLKATLKNSNGKAIAGKVVKLTFNGKTYNATTNSKGVASYKIGSKIIKKLKAGKTYTLQARYVNDIAKGKIKVEK